jgi:phosphate transport system substrate-binding protein
MIKSGSRIMLHILAVVLVFATVGWAQSSGSDQETIVVRGSDSMAAMVDSYAKEFIGKKPSAHIVVSGGSDNGWNSFVGGQSAICMASSEITAEEKRAAIEKGKEVHGATVGWGGVVIIVHPNNPINELSVEQVSKIFAGGYKNWKELGGPDEAITVLTVGEKREGTLAYVRDTLVKAPIAPNAVVKTYFRSIVGGVAEAPSATGFVRVRNIIQLEEQGQQKKVKVIAIKENEQSLAVLPTRETVNNGTYPIARPYLLYIDGKSDSKLAKEFFEFAASKNPRAKVSNAR